MSATNTSQGSFIDRQKYLDALKMRAFGLPERSILEGSHGTKAEADVHADIAPNVFHVPGVPAVVQTHPGVPAAAGAVFQTISFTFQVPVDSYQRHTCGTGAYLHN